jgi:hypothetical protein
MGVYERRSATLEQPIPILDQTRHLACPDGERARHQFAIGAQDTLDLLRGEEQKPANDASRSPAEAPSHVEGRAFVPAELALDGPKIVDPRLELDHQHDSGLWIEGEEVDPAM